MEQRDTANKTSADHDAKPRLVLMGEFSAGKSTLSNILLDSAPLPMRVTATRLPPVQISYGEPAAYAIGMDGQPSPIDIEALEDVSLEDTLMIDIHMKSDVLQLCSLLDMPGISDPNMPQEIWEGVIEAGDRVIWCTHATQAWRQSEAAIWKTLKDKTSGENLLLITQFDKLQNDRDRNRVLKRVQHETEGLFDAVYPVSLLEALNAGDDLEIWQNSGAAALSEHVVRYLVAREPKFPALQPETDEVTRNDLRDTAALRAHCEAHTTLVPDHPVSPRRVLPEKVSRQGTRHERPALRAL